MTKFDFLLVALAQAAFLAMLLYTGQLVFRRKVWADRNADPMHFWLCVIGIAVTIFAAVAEIFCAPYSN